MNKKAKLKKSDIVLICIYPIMILLNVVARLSEGFSDFYVEKIFPIVSFPLMWFTGLFPFAIGECVVAIWVVTAIIGIPALIITVIIKRNDGSFCNKLSRFSLRFSLWILAFLLTTETLNCFIMYQCSTFSSRYFDETEHTEELLLEALDAVVTQVVDLHDNFTRNEDGYIVPEYDDYSAECIASMKKISETYSSLSGYYPKPKPIMTSFFMSQRGTIGLFVPFTMEATYNRDIQPIAKPSTLCHELAHLKGIIQEDEANFVAMISCFSSDSDVVKYSGYLDALYYLYSDAKKLQDTEYENEYISIIIKVPAIVWTNDISSFTADYWEKNKDKEIIPTEKVEAVSEAITDAALQLNGVKDGIMSYYRVVELLMDYYASLK